MTTYDKYKTTKYWKLIDSELKALEKNQDISIPTNRDYVIGALVKKISDNVTTTIPSKKTSGK